MYKLSEDFIRRQVCGETLLMPVGEKTKDYNGIFTLSETGAFLLNAALNGADLPAAAAAMATEFEIDAETAKADAEAFFAELIQMGILLMNDSCND